MPASAAVARTRPSIGSHPPPPLLRLRSDEQLLALFRAGHDDAFRVIHDRYRQRLFAYTRQMLAHRQDAEDALQDIFVRAYAGLRANHRELALRAWLYRVAHNRCIDELRRPSPPPPEVIELLRSPMHDPIAEADQRESLRRLIADVRRLPDQQRSALLMRELGGMSYADLAAALGVTIPAVKSLLVRARLGLAQALEARDTACSEIREELVLSHDRGLRPNATARRHMRDCAGCREFRHQLRGVSRRFAALVPTLGPLGVLANLLGVGGAGSGAAGGALAAGGAAGTGTAVTGTAVTGSTVVGLGTMTAGATHVATLLAAAVVTAGGAVELQHTLKAAPHHLHHAPVAAVLRARPSPPRPAPAASAGTPEAAAVPASVIDSPVRAQVSQTAAAPAHPSASASTQTKPSPSTTPPARAKHQPRSTGGISTVISVGGATPTDPSDSTAALAAGTSATSTSGSPSSGTVSTTQPTGASSATSGTQPSSPTASPEPGASSTSPSDASTATSTGTGSSTGTTTGGSLVPAQ
ncbi:MAG: sigma-70 family RNA polymerase sigma factor [Solirubrobacterales bacterium]|nr:sigma-70 family RNA polymerase sigma factor [Solirubrobacterales bacterium]